MNDNLGNPTIRKANTRVWLYTQEEMKAHANGRRHCTLACWFVEAPWAHPLWHSYCLAVYHLRSNSDTGPAKIYLAGATHEVLLGALDPDWIPKDRSDSIGRHIMHSINFAAQIIEPTDEAAVARVRAAVQEILDGTLSPDEDFRHQWVQRFNGSMLRK